MTIHMIRTKFFSSLKPSRRSLGLVDVVALIAIFFSSSIYQSTLGFLTLHQAEQATPTDFSVSASNNYWGMGFELVSLAVAGVYLVWRRFDFTQLDFRFNRYTLPLAVLFGVSADMVAGGYDFIHYLLAPMSEQEATEAVLEQGLTPD